MDASRKAFEAWKRTMMDGFNEWDAWQAATKQAVPEGYVVVPKEPTTEMCEAGYYEFDPEQMDFDAANMWRVMILHYKPIKENQ